MNEDHHFQYYGANLWNNLAKNLEKLEVPDYNVVKNTKHWIPDTETFQKSMNWIQDHIPDSQQRHQVDTLYID